MLKKEYILECLEKYCKFDEDLCEGTFYEKVIRPLEAVQCFDDWFYDSGVSKGVLVFDELDYVIKIPFYCEYLEGDGYYDEDDNWVQEIEDGPSGYPFNGVEVEGFSAENDWDYCETESYRYLVAKRNGVEEFFAETWMIGKIRQWPVYAQVKACMFRSEASYSERSRKNYSDAERETAKTIKQETGFYVESEWLMDFLSYWGKERLMTFIEFCNQWLIDDLHGGNLGYVCGVPCLIDYSSFNG